MKFTAAALLAIGAFAIQLKDDGSQGPPPDSEFPFPEPECGEAPEGVEDKSPMEHFDMADVDESGDVDE